MTNENEDSPFELIVMIRSCTLDAVKSHKLTTQAPKPGPAAKIVKARRDMSETGWVPILVV